jgi:lipoprotein signal peptidase
LTADAYGPVEPHLPAPAPGAPRAERLALHDVGAHLRLWVVAGLGLALDLWSKEWAFTTLRQGGRRVLIPDVLEFVTTLNPGALFGIGAGHTAVFLVASVLALALVVWMFAQSPRRNWLTHIALGAILAGALGNMYDRAFVSLLELRQQTPAGMAMRYLELAPGPPGEAPLLYEYPRRPSDLPVRLTMAMREQLSDQAGHVRDFIKIPTRWVGGRELWPWVFNVADMLLVGGVAILAVKLLRERKPASADAEASPADGRATPADARAAPAMEPPATSAGGTAAGPARTE